MHFCKLIFELSLPNTIIAMSLFKFRVWMEDDDTVFRDIEVLPTNSMLEFHKAILTAFGFDHKHEASFFKSNDNWQKGKEISLNKKEGALLLDKVALVQLIDDPHQKFLYLYDYQKEWSFCCEILSIGTEKPENKYPRLARKEGEAPKQYGESIIASKGDLGFEESLQFDGMMSGGFERAEEEEDGPKGKVSLPVDEDGVGDHGSDDSEEDNEDDGGDDYGNDDESYGYDQDNYNDY